MSSISGAGSDDLYERHRTQLQESTKIVGSLERLPEAERGPYQANLQLQRKNLNAIARFCGEQLKLAPSDRVAQHFIRQTESLMKRIATLNNRPVFYQQHEETLKESTLLVDRFRAMSQAEQSLHQADLQSQRKALKEVERFAGEQVKLAPGNGTAQRLAKETTPLIRSIAMLNLDITVFNANRELARRREEEARNKRPLGGHTTPSARLVPSCSSDRSPVERFSGESSYLASSIWGTEDFSASAPALLCSDTAEEGKELLAFLAIESMVETLTSLIQSSWDHPEFPDMAIQAYHGIIPHEDSITAHRAFLKYAKALHREVGILTDGTAEGAKTLFLGPPTDIPGKADKARMVFLRIEAMENAIK